MTSKDLRLKVQPWFLLEHNFEIWAGYDGQNMYQQLEGSF